MKNLLRIADLPKEKILELINLAEKVKRNPKAYEGKLHGKTLLMVFAKPSLRTHLSFDIAMNQLGGHAIFYSLENSTLGQKESIKDFSKVISRYVNVVMARLFEHSDIQELAKYSSVPIINGLTNFYHPCQILGDLLTIKEKLGLDKITLAYLGDANNNITHDLIAASNKLGFKLIVSCPNKPEFLPNPQAIGGLKYTYEKDPRKAVDKANVVYTDTWMSYHIPKSKEKSRIKSLRSYQVNSNLLKNKLFMHCLPAKRGQEVTDEVLDSRQSIVYQQAENRIHAQKAVLLKLLNL